MEQISRFTIRTSGRRVMRRCLRKWGYQSSMKRNLERKGTEQNINFWFGSAIHFAMEDFFGHNRFGDVDRAFQAYYAAFPTYERPPGADEHYYLGLGMLENFKQWYSTHNEAYKFETVWMKDGVEVPVGTEGAEPLVEQSFMLKLPRTVWIREDTGAIIDRNGDNIVQRGTRLFYVPVEDQTWILEPPRIPIKEVPIYYHGTLDRVVKDSQGRWWIMDWKTAKAADTNKLDTDDQISAYMWAAEQWFGRPIHGFIYVQLTKELPKPPKRLANGTLSVDKKQRTTFAMLKEEIIKDYGQVNKAPKKLVDFLYHLADMETPEGDRFIRWDMVTRNKEQKEATFHNIMGEIDIMVNPSQYLFPNPTRDCIWDCPFRDACMLHEQGKYEEEEQWLQMNFEPRSRKEDGNIDPWRENVPWPSKDREGKAIGTLVKQMDADANVTLNILLPDKYKDL